MINALPGVTSDAQNDDIQQTRPSVNGTHFADQGVYVDGVDTTFAKFGGSRVFLPTTALTEVSMEAGGSSAEYGRYIGSSTNVIVKSGTNRWHADVLWNHPARRLERRLQGAALPGGTPHATVSHGLVQALPRRRTGPGPWTDSTQHRGRSLHDQSRGLPARQQRVGRFQRRLRVLDRRPSPA